MVSLLSASAFGANVPSPVSPAFPGSTFGPSPPSSPTRTVSPITPPNEGLPYNPWKDSKAFSAPRAVPPRREDSLPLSPNGTSRKLYVPPRKDSMRNTRYIGHHGHARPTEDLYFIPGSPHASVHSRDSATEARGHPEMPPTPPRQAFNPPPKATVSTKLSLFPVPPTPRPHASHSSHTQSHPTRPILKQNRSHTESSLPTLSSKHSSSEFRPKIGALQRAHTLPILENESSTQSFTQLVRPSNSTIPTITIKPPERRRPSAVELIAAKSTANLTKIKTGPSRACQVQMIPGPQIESQMAVKWVRKEEKQRRRLEKEGLKLAVSAHSTPVHQEITVPVFNHATISPWMDSPTLGRPTLMSSPIANLPQTAPIRNTHPDSSAPAAPYNSSATSLSPSSPTLTLPQASPTINRPHPLREFVSSRSRSETRHHKSPPRKPKHTRNASDSTQHCESQPLSHRGRTRARSPSISNPARDWSTAIPPTTGPLDIRKSTFRPFDPALDPEALAALQMLKQGPEMYELAARREKERGGIKVPRSKYLEVKPVPPPKEGTGAGRMGRTGSPLAKLAGLVK